MTRGEPARGLQEDATARGDRSLEVRVALWRNQDDDGAVVVRGEASGQQHGAI